MIKDKVDFDIIRYANCWEDADVLLAALSLQPSCSVLCIASAGDNALALLSTAPKAVHAIDISLPQLYLTELKQVAFSVLEYDELLQLLGVVACANRVGLYEHISGHLSKPAKNYWDGRRYIIEAGVIHYGKFEKYFQLFRKYLLPLVHSRKTINRLLAPKTGLEQRTFYEKSWNTYRWKMLMGLFFSKYIMGKYGRDPQFLKHVDVPVAAYIRQRSEEHLRSTACQDNYLLHMIFTGQFGSSLPFYLRKENFMAIKNHIGRLTLSESEAGEAIQERPFDAYCLSDIFEYMSGQQFSGVVDTWSGHIPQRSKLAYWNLMVPRSFASVAPSAFAGVPGCSQLSNIDKGFFYSSFVCEYRK